MNDDKLSTEQPLEGEARQKGGLSHAELEDLMLSFWGETIELPSSYITGEVIEGSTQNSEFWDYVCELQNSILKSITSVTQDLLATEGVVVIKDSVEVTTQIPLKVVPEITRELIQEDQKLLGAVRKVE